MHCGFHLAVFPAYQPTGDENNSSRGRLRWRSEEASGRLSKCDWTDVYTAECVGCLACETARPATVPYGEIVEHIRHEHNASKRFKPKFQFHRAAGVVKVLVAKRAAIAGLGLK